jgi:hypothetical protein
MQQRACVVCVQCAGSSNAGRLYVWHRQVALKKKKDAAVEEVPGECPGARR